jgi:hypothetical protein
MTQITEADILDRLAVTCRRVRNGDSVREIVAKYAK